MEEEKDVASEAEASEAAEPRKKCLICNKFLRKLTKTDDWDSRVYHITCWRTLIMDIKHYDKIAYTKYGCKRVIDGKTLEEHRADPEPWVVDFD